MTLSPNASEKTIMCQANDLASGNAVSREGALQSDRSADAQWIPATPDMLAFMAKFADGVEWGSVTAKPDAEHVTDFADSLRMTREHFDLDDAPRELHGVYKKGSAIVICHTGTSPNSAMTAQIIAGLLHSATRVSDEISRLTAENARLREALGELYIDNIEARYQDAVLRRARAALASAPTSIEEPPSCGDTADHLASGSPDTKNPSTVEHMEPTP